MPDIPDFTVAHWQTSKKDAELSQAILTGGKFMPPMKDKLSLADAEKMVRFIRDFQGGKQVVSVESAALPEKPVPIPASVAVPAPPPTTKPIAAALLAASTSTEVGQRVRAGAVIFRQYCLVCHGPDGTGSAMRAQLPPIPDFSRSTWQAEKNDPQLLISILDGKGTLMPANRGRVSEEQARDLVAYIRAFGPAEVRGGQMAPSDFQKQLDSLQQQFDTLQKQMQTPPPPPGKQ
jgi:mono/diheme cytochrome c family protein